MSTMMRAVPTPPVTELDVPAVPGLTLRVLRSAGMDCTAGGITSWAQEVRLVGVVDRRHPSAGGPEVPVNVWQETPVVSMTDYRLPVYPLRADVPEVALELRNMGSEVLLTFVPVKRAADGSVVTMGAWTMAGGNYAATSDSRLEELIEAWTGRRFYGAINVHDRIEVAG